MKKFEYTTHMTDHGPDWPSWRWYEVDTNILDKFGDEGWELCETLTFNEKRQYIFKRQIIT